MCFTEDLSSMPYRRKLPVESLSDVENPWKGVTLNRCILLAIVVVMISTGVEQAQEAVDALMADEEAMALLDYQKLGSSLYDTLAFWDWDWGIEEELERKRARRKHRKKSPSEGLLRDKDGDGVEDAEDGEDVEDGEEGGEEEEGEE